MFKSVFNCYRKREWVLNFGHPRSFPDDFQSRLLFKPRIVYASLNRYVTNREITIKYVRKNENIKIRNDQLGQLLFCVHLTKRNKRCNKISSVYFSIKHLTHTNQTSIRVSIFPRSQCFTAVFRLDSTSGIGHSRGKKEVLICFEFVSRQESSINHVFRGWKGESHFSRSYFTLREDEYTFSVSDGLREAAVRVYVERSQRKRLRPS